MRLQAVTWKSDALIAPLIVLASALLLFSLNLDRPPHPDELHHVLAGEHLLETGRPLIGEGEYQRGILHTWLVAISYEVFGEGLASARMPSVLLVALLAAILFVWVRREAGHSAAWLTAALFVLSPFTVEIAQFSRFYALQMFGFVLGSMCAYYTLAAAASPLRRVLLGALALAFLALAVSAQVTSLVGMIGIAAWVFGLVVQRVFFDSTTSRRLKVAVAIGLVAAAALGILVVTLTDLLALGWEYFRVTPLFNADLQDEFWFYYLRFFIFYPTLWSLVGIVALFAIVQSPRLAWYAISVFSISFLLMSFAGTKATRYLSFAPPFLAIVWGIGLAYVLPPLWRYVRATRAKLIDTLVLSQRLGSIVGTSAVLAAVAIVVLTNAFWLRTVTMIGNVALPIEVPATDWPAAREALASWTRDADIMITTEELGAIYFLGRSDIRFSPSKLQEIPRDQQHEFGIDHRTGRPLITTAESVEQLIECFPRGIVVGPIEGWGSPILINEAVQAVLSAHAKPIDVPKESHLYAWGWTHEPRETPPSYCSDLGRFSARKMG